MSKWVDWRVQGDGEFSFDNPRRKFPEAFRSTASTIEKRRMEKNTSEVV